MTTALTPDKELSCNCLPTPAMCRAAVIYANGPDVYNKVPKEVTDIEESMYHEIWKAMNTAAPAAAQPTEQEQSQFFCGVDFADGVLAVSVMRRRPDDVAEMIHSEQIEVAAQPQQAKPLSDVEIDNVKQGPSQSYRDFARAAIAAFCLKNGIKEQENATATTSKGLT